jgi:ribonucleotide reductase alpha subunit
VDYFKDAGIGAVSLSPIYKSSNVDFGYDVTNFKDVDSTLGTLEDFDNLHEKLKEHGKSNKQVLLIAYFFCILYIRSRSSLISSPVKLSFSTCSTFITTLTLHIHFSLKYFQLLL